METLCPKLILLSKSLSVSIVREWLTLVMLSSMLVLEEEAKCLYVLQMLKIYHISINQRITVVVLNDYTASLVEI